MGQRLILLSIILAILPYSVLHCQENYPPGSLYVDQLTLEVSWNEPQIVQLENDFESLPFPPTGWESDSWTQCVWDSCGITVPWDSYFAYLPFDSAGYRIGTANPRSLVTAAMCLQNSDDYILEFFSLLQGDTVHTGYILSSDDGGANWSTVDVVSPAGAWSYQVVDLSDYSGSNGPDSLNLAFFAPGDLSWALDDMRVIVPDSVPEYLNFYIYLDDSIVGTTNEISFNFDFLDLTYGAEYVAAISANYPTGLSDKIDYQFISTYLPPVTNLTGECGNEGIILSWEDPDTLFSCILGYNVYRDGEFVNSIPPSPNPGPIQSYIDEGLNPGHYAYSITVVYDLSCFGFPGETGESMEAGPVIVVCSYGWNLPFIENWDSGSFDPQNWTTDGQNWSLTGQMGQPAPCAEFTWNPISPNYSIALESYPLRADTLYEGQVFLDFNLKLEDVNGGGTEQLLVQVWNWESQVWSDAMSFSNQEGSFNWDTVHLDITPYALSQVFKIRFYAFGESSVNISGWYLDNIHVYRSCDSPTDLEVWRDYPYWSCNIALLWAPPAGIPVDEWIHWDDSVNYSALGTGDTIEFDVAARWEPFQLVNYQGSKVTQVAFFPAEESAVYRIRIWQGAGPANLVLDQLVPSPVIGSWNFITLENPVPVDVTQELWIGYFISSTTGYPAGYDDGPAIDGYGNMINYGGWQTLLQVNPELDYNWNLQAYVTNDSISSRLNSDFSHYNIYRSVSSSAYQLIAMAENEEFVDYDLFLGVSYCYKVSAVYYMDADTCESDLSNEDCDLCLGVPENSFQNNVETNPNPTGDFIFIRSSSLMNEVSLYSLTGDCLFSSDIYDDEQKLDLRNIPTGIYILKINTRQQQLFRKIIVAH